ncbi:MAG: hypothetical protein WC525_09800 [Candidatus Thermoplasmatota archaeon]
MCNEFIAGIIAATLGIIGTLLGTYLYYYFQQRRELKQFYAWIYAILNRYIEGKDNPNEKSQVSIALEEKEIHYLYNKNWLYIPNKTKIDGTDIYPRDLIVSFLRSSKNLEQILDPYNNAVKYHLKDYELLKKWLELKIKIAPL